MRRELSQDYNLSLLDDTKTFKRLELALRKSHELDQTENMNGAAANFCYEDCKDEMWNPENFSLLWGTWLWENSSPFQRVKLNQLYWVAYYSQIISAEIATIFYNQTSAASLYGMEDFRIICDTLDLESTQERAHINAFKTVSEEVEINLFGERVFTYPMRNPFVQTMIFSDLNQLQKTLRKAQLSTYAVLSAHRPFIGCQYFVVRGLRTLNGKIVQQKLSKYCLDSNDVKSKPVPSQISYFHFMDESFHFNTSTVVSHDAIRSVPSPNGFERLVSNMAVKGCQKDHYNFSTAINGIFWYDPALYPKIYKILRSPIFGMSHAESLEAMKKSFCYDSDGLQASHLTHKQALESYKKYLVDFQYVNAFNKEMKLMGQNSVEKHLKENQRQLKVFERKVKDHGVKLTSLTPNSGILLDHAKN